MSYKLETLNLKPETLLLSTFLFEEAKHTDFFRRFLDEVVGAKEPLSHYHSTNYHTLFYDVLPTTMQRLRHDPLPAAQVRAA